MSWGFSRRRKLFPGITVNLSKQILSKRPWEGISLTGRLGPRGVGVSTNTRTRKLRGSLLGLWAQTKEKKW